MRWAKQAGESKLDWSILDVEQEEWERRLADLGVAAAANGFPVYSPAAAVETVGGRASVAPWSRACTACWPLLRLPPYSWAWRRASSGYGVWRTAQEGICAMEGDVANAVRLESLRTHATGNRRPGRACTSPSRQSSSWTMRRWRPSWLPSTQRAAKLYVQPELRFYVQTAKGWQRSEPIAGFWGPTETLDTAHLHFVFGRRDQAVVAAAAPGAEAMYVLLHRATGVDLAPGRPGADRDRAGVFSCIPSSWATAASG